MLRWVALLLLAYLTGAFPTGPLVARLYGVDLTQYGSRRTGATNALRVLGRRAGALVLAGDMLKGVVAVGLWPRLLGCHGGQSIAALAAVTGHTYSIFLGGRGGRGVATGLGGLLVLAPAAVLPAAAAALGTMAATRYVSLGSLVGAAVGGAAVAWRVGRGHAPRSHLIYALGGSAFIFYSHRDNVARLLSGTERRLGGRADDAGVIPSPPGSESV